MRIAYLIDTISSDRAGTERQLLGMIGRLAQDTTLITLRPSRWLAENPPCCPTVSLGYRGFLDLRFPAVLASYLRCLKERRIELVQTFFEDAMFVGCLGRLLATRRHSLVVSRRDLGLGSDEPFYHRLYHRARPLALRACHGLVVNAEAIKAHLEAYEGVPPEKIAVIRNGVDPAPPPSVLPELFREQRADLWLAVVANLKPVKRIDVFLRALALLKRRCPEVIRGVILGQGHLVADLERMAAELGISDRVHFAGAVANVTDYLYGADLGVLCSDREGLSNAILEYMACGLPVVATAVGGNGELVDEGNGICIPPGNELSLAEAIYRLRSPDLRRRLGERSLQKVRKGHSWSTVMQKWESYYARFDRGES